MQGAGQRRLGRRPTRFVSTVQGFRAGALARIRIALVHAGRGAQQAGAGHVTYASRHRSLIIYRNSATSTTWRAAARTAPVNACRRVVPLKCSAHRGQHDFRGVRRRESRHAARWRSAPVDIAALAIDLSIWTRSAVTRTASMSSDYITVPEARQAHQPGPVALRGRRSRKRDQDWTASQSQRYDAECRVFRRQFRAASSRHDVSRR